jgi:hypothetical protein
VRLQVDSQRLRPDCNDRRAAAAARGSGTVTCRGGLIATAVCCRRRPRTVAWGSGARLQVRVLSAVCFASWFLTCGWVWVWEGVPAVARVPYDELVQERISVDDRYLVVALLCLVYLVQIAKGELMCRTL